MMNLAFGFRAIDAAAADGESAMKLTRRVVLRLAPILLLGSLTGRAGAAVKAATAAPGSVPTAINYQGSLSDNGAPVTGARGMEFQVYDAATGGNLLWDSGPMTVLFDHGVFNAVLSISTTALAGGGARYLQVQVDNNPLSPRDALNAAPYALVAKAVEGSLDITGGGISVTLPSVGSVLYVSSTTGSVGIGTSAPAYRLDVQGDVRSTGTVLAPFVAAASAVVTGGSFSVGTTALSVSAAGVGIGTSSPDQRLSVAGSISLTGVLISSGAGNSYFKGSVGLGTVSPASKLHVVDGDIRVSSSPGMPARGIIFQDGTTLQTGAAPATAGPLVNAGDALIQAAAGGGSGNILLCTGSAACTPTASRLIVANGGNVGISTGNPVTTLEVNGSAQFGAGAAKSTFTALGNLQLVSGATVTANGTLAFSTAPTAAAATPNLFIDAAGRVGVGTASPASLLHAAGDVRADGVYRVSSLAAVQLKSPGLIEFGSEGAADTQLVAGSGAPLVYLSQTGTVGVGTAGAAPALFTVGSGFLSVTSAGNVGIGTTSPGSRLHMSSGTMILDGPNPSIILGVSTFVVTGGQVGVGVANPSALFQVAAGTLTVTSAGLVGIDTLNPAAALDVAGVVQIGSGTAKSTFTNAGNLIVTGDVTANTFNGGVLLTNPMSSTLILNGVPALKTTLQPGINISTHLFVFGSLGVGTTSPGGKLHMSSGVFIIDGNNPALYVGQGVLAAAQGQVGVGTSSPGTKLHMSSGTLTIDGAGPGLSVGVNKFVVSAGLVGIGTSSPGAKLHLSSGTLLIDGTSPALSVGQTAFVVSGGQAGIGTSQPAALLDVAGAAQFGTAPAKSTFTAAGNLQLVSGATITANGTLTLSTAPSAAQATPALFIDGAGRVGLGTGAPNAKLTVGTALSGSALSGALTVNAGSLGSAAGNELALASLGFLSSNNESLGVRAVRTSAGSDWTTTAIGLGMDVDNTVRQGAALWLSANGNVGIGTNSPASKLNIQDGDLQFSVTSGVHGILFSDGSRQTTAAGSSQWVGSGANIFNTNAGDVGIGTTNPTAKLHVANNGKATLELQNTITNGTPFTGSQWTLFADNASGFGGNLTFGFYDVANSKLRMGLDNGGNVGIGTTSPGALLDVAGGSAIGIRYLKSAAQDARITVGDNTKSWSLASGHALAGDFSIVEELGSPADRLYIKQGGNVGIGTTSPVAPLSVVGGATGAETVLAYLRSNGAGTNTGTILRLTNDSSDSAGTGGADIEAKRTNASFAGDSDLIFKTFYNGTMGGGLWVKANGNVGVGTSNPAGKLDVSGDAYVQGQAVASNFKYVTSFSDWRNAANCAVSTWCDIPGRTISYTKTRAASLLRIVYQDTLGTNGTSYDQCEWQILVDGTQVLFFSEADNSDTPNSWRMNNASHQAVASGFSAAAHTIKVQNKRNAGATDCLQGWNTSGQGSLSVEEVGP